MTIARAEYMIIKTNNSRERVNVTLSFREARIIVAALLELAHQIEEGGVADGMVRDIITDWGRLPEINSEAVELLANRIHPSIELQYPCDDGLGEPEDLVDERE